MARFLFLIVFLLLSCLHVPVEADEPAALPPATADNLPRWRGFNLTEKFHRDWRNGPFLESDFQWIHELGFNFVRLPMDYRVWIEGNDWTKFDEKVLEEIDQAVDWGGRYGIHVSINFHRAPGYTVAKPPESKSLWTDAETQQICAAHWAMFARRYRELDNRRLSFNLFNEPAGVDEQAYVDVVRKIVAAIRREDPDRLIISDGLDYGQRPAMALAKLGLAQATRGYVPMDISHHQASWAGGTPDDPTPVWPRPSAQGMLYSPHKPEMPKESKAPLILHGPFPKKATLRLRVAVVSFRATLVVYGDGEALWTKEFVCGPGKGEWQKAVFLSEWNVYQNIYNRDYTMPIPAGVRRLEIRLTGGDWLRLAQLGIACPGREEDVLPLLSEWGERPAVVRYSPHSNEGPFVCDKTQNRQWLAATMIAPWKQAEAAGIGVFVGEFGCYNKTPHDVALRWLEDSLANWQQAGWGWALWNFRGPFGILDSGREDVEYEDFHGHKLDRKMLALLQRY
jgi:aryl-phospho-beta-D-glucosidase BglC (GH1 family)